MKVLTNQNIYVAHGCKFTSINDALQHELAILLEYDCGLDNYDFSHKLAKGIIKHQDKFVKVINEFNEANKS